MFSFKGKYFFPLKVNSFFSFKGKGFCQQTTKLDPVLVWVVLSQNGYGSAGGVLKAALRISRFCMFRRVPVFRFAKPFFGMRVVGKSYGQYMMQTETL